MRKALMSAIFASGMLAIAGAASAADILQDRQLDGITAGADIATNAIATALVDYDIATDANHDVTADAATYTSISVAVIFDESAVGSLVSQSSLNTTDRKSVV